MATSAPSSARALATAAPIPREPPVTSATFPFSVFGIGITPVATFCIDRYIKLLTEPVKTIIYRSLHNATCGRKMNDRPAQRGRPRSFDIDRALGRALEAFCRKGYEGTSISDL